MSWQYLYDRSRQGHEPPFLRKTLLQLPVFVHLLGIQRKSLLLRFLFVVGCCLCMSEALETEPLSKFWLLHSSANSLNFPKNRTMSCDCKTGELLWAGKPMFTNTTGKAMYSFGRYFKILQRESIVMNRVYTCHKKH